MTLNSLFWIGANYHRPIDLPDTTGLCWREAIIWCLENVWPRSRTTLDPETELPKPTADGEPEPAVVIEPSTSGTAELMITVEPEPQVSDQVREPTARAMVEIVVEIAGAKESPAHCTTAGGEHKLDSGDLIDFHLETP
ncbi:hypothetical protein M9458_042007, partial [Cirrhinus mrigala]